MTLPGETIATGANKTCDDCGVTVELKVLQSSAGYYIGTRCECGPYSRESDYYSSFESAQHAFNAGIFGRS
jgi:hypothetical protein